MTTRAQRVVDIRVKGVYCSHWKVIKGRGQSESKGNLHEK